MIHIFVWIETICLLCPAQNDCCFFYFCSLEFSFIGPRINYVMADIKKAMIKSDIL